MDDLRDKMLDFRARHDLSQEELAEKCHVTKQTIWAVEKGIQTPSKLTERKIRNVVEE